MGFEPMAQGFSILCSNQLSYLDKSSDEVGFEPTINYLCQFSKLMLSTTQPFIHKLNFRVAGLEPTIFCTQSKYDANFVIP